MAKQVEKPIREKTVVRYYAMKWSSSAHVENVSIIKAN